MEIPSIWFKECSSRILKGHGQILEGLDFARCYIDDIIVFSANADEHQRHLQLVLSDYELTG